MKRHVLARGALGSLSSLWRRWDLDQPAGDTHRRVGGDCVITQDVHVEVRLANHNMRRRRHRRRECLESFAAKSPQTGGQAAPGDSSVPEDDKEVAGGVVPSELIATQVASAACGSSGRLMMRISGRQSSSGHSAEIHTGRPSSDASSAAEATVCGAHSRMLVVGGSGTARTYRRAGRSDRRWECQPDSAPSRRPDWSPSAPRRVQRCLLVVGWTVGRPVNGVGMLAWEHQEAAVRPHPLPGKPVDKWYARRDARPQRRAVES